MTYDNVHGMDTYFAEPQRTRHEWELDPVTGTWRWIAQPVQLATFVDREVR